MSLNEEHVVLVNEKDEVLGTMEKMKAHQEGRLHRAFSIFLFNSKGDMLIHQRALGKYHSPGLWTNACCSHPRLDESYKDAAHRRLKEELGMSCALNYAFNFIYNESIDNGLIEHELDHVFIGHTDDLPTPNPEEVHDWKYLPVAVLLHEVKTQPENYTEWFKICLDKHVSKLLPSH